MGRKNKGYPKKYVFDSENNPPSHLLNYYWQVDAAGECAQLYHIPSNNSKCDGKWAKLPEAEILKSPGWVLENG